MIDFGYPLLILLIIPLVFGLVFFYFYGINTQKISGYNDLKEIYKTNSNKYKFKILFLSLGFLFLIFGFANPVIKQNSAEIDKNTYFILDLSYSMTATDINGMARYEIIKKGIEEFRNFNFIQFAGSVLKINHNELVNISEEYIKNINLINDGSSIGDALLFTSSLSGKDISTFLLFSDGAVNEGKDLTETLGYIKTRNIKIYTFGIGGDKETEVFVDNGLGDIVSKRIDQVDEVSLQKIALETGGEYFKVQSSKDLKEKIEELLVIYNFISLKILFLVLSLLSFTCYIFFNFKKSHD